MRVLLDTHVFLWAVASSPALKADARRMIQSAAAVFVSAASIWGIAVKARLRKIQADPDALVDAIDASGFLPLPVQPGHAARVARLPLLHPDPFDRLLVAQALAEPLRLLTADAALLAYGEIVTLV